MMPNDRRRLIAVDRAVGRYARSLRQGTNFCRADGDTDSQTANYHRSAERAELRAEQVKQVLMDFGIAPLHFFAYRDFGLQLDKLTREREDETLRHLARSAIGYWTAYGLRPDVISTICEQVFDLTVGQE